MFFDQCDPLRVVVREQDNVLVKKTKMESDFDFTIQQLNLKLKIARLRLLISLCESAQSLVSRVQSNNMDALTYENGIKFVKFALDVCNSVDLDELPHFHQ